MQLSSIFSRRTSWDWVLIFSYDVYPISFFEMELLSNIKSRKNVTVVVDDRNYKKLIADKYFKPHYLGVHYNLERIKVIKGGCFHPKLYLFLNEDTISLHVGSFNLTDTGFKRNYEVILTIESSIGDLNKANSVIIREVINFLRETFLTSNYLIESPSDSLKRIISHIVNYPAIAPIMNINSSPQSDLHFVSSLKRSILAEVKSHLGNSFNKIFAASLFYDSDLTAIKEVQRCTKKLSVYIPSTKSTFPKEYVSDNLNEFKDVNFYCMKKEDKHPRTIHSKIYRFEADKKVFDFITSANLTAPGFTNDSYPRNLEVGIIVAGQKGEFLKDADLEAAKIRDFNVLETDNPPSESPKEDISYEAIESAQYRDSKIYISLSKGFSNGVEPTLLEVLLLIDKAPVETYSLQFSGTECYIEPSLDIEGNRLIQIQLLDKNEKTISNPVYVMREYHNPNYLPSLGASAFNSCVQIGGIEGLERAFEYARNSGKKDWLFFLLSHWNLEKILRGIQPVPDSNSEPGDEDDGLQPALPTITDKEKIRRMRNNLGHIMPQVDVHKNLSKFLDGIEDQANGDIDELMKLYNNFCFPLFFEISRYFKEILIKEEEKKERNPHIRYPEYTWFNNYRKYERFMFLIFGALDHIVLQLSHKYRSDKLYSEFIGNAYRWVTYHTGKSLSEYMRHHQKTSNFILRLETENNRVNTCAL